MCDLRNSLEKRIEEYNRYYIYYSWRDDFPLLSVRPEEKVLVLTFVATGPYAVFEGDILIVGTVDEKNGVEIPVCAAYVVKVIEDKMPLDRVLKVIGSKEFDRILFSNEYTEEEKKNGRFEAKILKGIDLNYALERWDSVKDTVTQEELDEYNLSLMEKMKDYLSDYNL